jgi:membrane protein
VGEGRPLSARGPAPSPAGAASRPGSGTGAPRRAAASPGERWRDRLEAALQIAVTALRLFARNELTSHAAAVTFYFLLSAVPVVYLIVWISGTLLQLPALGEAVVSALAGIDERITLDQLRESGLLPDTAAHTAGGLSALAMLWASRQLLDAVQSAFRVIFVDAARRPAWQTWAVSLLLIPGTIAVIALLTIARAALDLLSGLGDFAWLAGWLPTLVTLAGNLLTPMILWALVVAAFSGLPARRPPTRLTLRIGLLCVLSFVVLRLVLAQFVHLDHYQGLYASLGTLILVLFWVFVVFLVFFFWAECLYATMHIDAIALEKLMLAAGGSGRPLSWLDRQLFGRRSRLNHRYGQSFAAGETILRAGEESTVAFFLDRGRVGLYRGEAIDPPGERLATVEAGQTFGEMAYLLQERRSATAVAETDVSLYVIPPALFEQLLALNPTLSRRIIETLCARLRQMNEAH